MNPFDAAISAATNRGTGTAVAGLAQNYQQLAPLATTYHSAAPSVPYAGYTAPKASTGVLPAFTGFLSNLGHETGHLAEGAATWLAHQAVNVATAPERYGTGIAHGILDRSDLNQIKSQGDQLTGRMQTLTNQYKSGQINNKQYKLGLGQLAQDFHNLDNQSFATTSRVSLDKQNAYKATIDTASDLLMLSGGFAKSTTIGIGMDGGRIALNPITAKTATDYLASKAATNLLEPVASTINKLALDSKLFGGLDHITQNVLQKATAEVVANVGPKMTAAEIARATATNVALKYPIYFNYMSTMANDVYKELDSGKNDAAVRQIGLNALLLLSGGPIGVALKYGGKALKGVSSRTFGQTSFWDELSKYYGDGTTSGFAKAITEKAASMDPEAKAEFLRNLNAVEATNVNATAGDVAAAVTRLAKGEQAKSISDLSQISHGEAIDDMVKMAKNFRNINDAAEKLGLGPIAVGRFDARSKGKIANLKSVQEWEDLKASNPNDAIANNANLDRQVKQAFDKYGGGSPEFKKYIMDIKAQTTIEGFPQDVLDAAAKEGYVPIRPRNLQAPFKEGEGKLVTNSKDIASGDFFTRAVQPLPVLNQVGWLFSHMGLSPNTSTQRVYQYFNDASAKNLERTGIAQRLIDENTAAEAQKAAKAAEKAATKTTTGGVASGFSKDELAFMEKQGITPTTHPDLFAKAEVKGEIQAGSTSGSDVAAPAPADTNKFSATDLIIKKLSNFANKQTIPITDLRMLTTKHIAEALGASREEALAVQKAIAKSFTDVPMTVRGMGDKAVDWTYRLPVGSPIMRRYLRIQGALRFSFNPFFQFLRVIPKTEMLTAAEGGGYIRSIFQGRAKQIDEIRDGMRKGGLLDEIGHIGNLTGNESVDFAGTGALDARGALGKNIHKHLLPMQERSIAGLIDAQAQRMGMHWKDYVTQYPHQAADTIQMIAEYDRKSNFLNSPLARTLNIAIFPFRFDAKVAGIFARNLGKSSMLTQVSVVNGLMKANQFLGSPEGHAWYQQNSEVIGLFKYITPIASLNEVFHSLVPGNDHSLGNFGELGGLPFGWIPALLDAEGLTQFNQPGVDAKTGEVFPKYIPATQKGQLAIAVQDLLTMLFSYPGQQVGLPSKGKATRSVANAITGAHNGTDLVLDSGALVPGQQGKKVSAAEPSSTPTSVTVPATHTDITTPRPMKVKPSRAESGIGKKKKADFTPQLLPGQTTLGQF